jgi:hypothetical protein
MAVNKTIGFLAASVLMGSMSVASFGQAQPGGNGGQPGQPGQPGGRGNRGNFDPAQFRQRMMQRIQEQLGATDEDMQALSPKIEKVMQLERDTRGGRGGFGRRGGGPGGPNAATDPNASAVQKAVSDLQETLKNKDAKPDEIKAKLDAVRQARAQAKQELTAAQQELKGLLTQRQEAVMVEMGMLE